jgi:hypothetical protein
MIEVPIGTHSSIGVGGGAHDLDGLPSLHKKDSHVPALNNFVIALSKSKRLSLVMKF